MFVSLLHRFELQQNCERAPLVFGCWSFIEVVDYS